LEDADMRAVVVAAGIARLTVGYRLQQQGFEVKPVRTGLLSPRSKLEAA
jgi:hypothetical protein